MTAKWYQMKHFEIGIQIITLIIGTGVLFDTHQFYKQYRYPFLKPMWFCYLFLNLGFLAGFISKYLLVNFFEDAMAFKTSFYFEIIDPFTSIFFIALVYYLAVLSRSFRDKDRAKNLHWVFIGFIVFIIIRTIIDLSVGQSGLISQVMDVVNLGLLFFIFILSYAILVPFAFRSHKLEDKNKADPLRALGLFYLIGCSLIILSSAFAGIYHRLILVSICLLFNIFPFIWYRHYLPGIGNALASLAADTDLSPVWEKYGVTSRQQEIIRLILKGKSNRDIADALYLAPHTIKNHIYNLYQKLGVKSRFELVNLVLNHAKK